MLLSPSWNRAQKYGFYILQFILFHLKYCKQVHQLLSGNNYSVFFSRSISSICRDRNPIHVFHLQTLIYQCLTLILTKKSHYKRYKKMRSTLAQMAACWPHNLKVEGLNTAGFYQTFFKASPVMMVTSNMNNSVWMCRTDAFIGHTVKLSFC